MRNLFFNHICFSHNINLQIQVFGKLPIYNDYISFFTQRNALSWQNFLVSKNSKQSKLFNERSFFIFQFSKNKSIFVGVIDNSSDGTRQFPFSVFVDCRQSWLKNYLIDSKLLFIFKELDSIFLNVKKIENIDQCYQFLQQKVITVENTKQTINSLIKNIFKRSKQKIEWPYFEIFPIRDVYHQKKKGGRNAITI